MSGGQIPITVTGINPHEWKGALDNYDPNFPGNDWYKKRGQYMSTDCFENVVYPWDTTKECNEYVINNNYRNPNGSNVYIGYQNTTNTDLCISQGAENCSGLFTENQNHCWVGQDNLKTYFGDHDRPTIDHLSFEGTIIAHDETYLKGCTPTIKVTSRFNIPDPADNKNTFIDPFYPNTLKVYSDANNINKTDYNNYMEDYCFTEVNENCKNGTESCPRLFQDYPDNPSNNPQVVCDQWGSIQENKAKYDNRLTSFCNNNPSNSLCDCIAAPKPRSTYYKLYNELSSSKDLQGTYNCWLKACKNDTTSVRTMLMKDTTCVSPKCINFVDARGSSIIDSKIAPYIDCVGDYPAPDTSGGYPPDTSGGTSGGSILDKIKTLLQKLNIHQKILLSVSLVLIVFLIILILF